MDAPSGVGNIAQGSQFFAPTPKFSRHERGRPSNGVTSDMGPTRKSWQNTTQLTMLLPVYEIQDAEFARLPCEIGAVAG